MIGTSSFILESSSVLFPLALFLFSIYWLFSNKRTADCVFVLIAGLMLFLMGNRYVHQVSNHLVLSRLSADDVAGIRIQDTAITSASDVGRVVAALNESLWFSPNHGGWDKTMRMEIHMKDGSARRYSVASYRRRKGAVIRFSWEWLGMRWSAGYAFSEGLPDALEQAGTKGLSID